MSSLGGCQHGLAQRWIDLDLPLSTFMMNARMSVRRCDDYELAKELLYLAVLLISMLISMFLARSPPRFSGRKSMLLAGGRR